jgi:peroxidase
LLESTAEHESELESDKNFGLRNFKYIVDVIKEEVERQCPGVVSCADILILSGRDGIAMVKYD